MSRSKQRTARPPATPARARPAPVKPPVPPTSAGERPAPAEIVLRVVVIVVASWGAVLLAFYGATLTPFRLGGVLVPVSLALAVITNLGLMMFVRFTVPGRFPSLVPGLVWLGVAFWASGTTAEGDVLLAGNNWVAAGYLLAGSATVGIAGYRMILPPAR